jgi:hypothetical protein
VRYGEESYSKSLAGEKARIFGRKNNKEFGKMNFSEFSVRDVRVEKEAEREKEA